MVRQRRLLLRGEFFAPDHSPADVLLDAAFEGTLLAIPSRGGDSPGTRPLCVALVTSVSEALFHLQNQDATQKNVYKIVYTPGKFIT